VLLLRHTLAALLDHGAHTKSPSKTCGSSRSAPHAAANCHTHVRAGRSGRRTGPVDQAVQLDQAAQCREQHSTGDSRTVALQRSGPTSAGPTRPHAEGVRRSGRTPPAGTRVRRAPAPGTTGRPVRR
jgi:hypothetical protein